VPLVRCVANVVAASKAADMIVVTGHDRSAVAAALAGLSVTIVHNSRHLDGMGTSIAAGIAALATHCDGALVVQGDMPELTAALIDRLVDRFALAGANRIVHPVDGDGRQGNPVLWPRRLFGELARLDGDRGGKAILSREADGAEAVRVTTAAAFTDIDTPADLARHIDRR
jgi:molybdenum cofactor cytidylyltransferase